MAPRTARCSALEQPLNTKTIPPLDQESRVALPTVEAAHHLCKRPATLQAWAAKNQGPITPLRVGSRLLWPTASIKNLLGVGR